MVGRFTGKEEGGEKLGNGRDGRGRRFAGEEEPGVEGGRRRYRQQFCVAGRVNANWRVGTGICRTGEEGR